MTAQLKLFLFGEPQLQYHNVVLNVERRKIFALLAFLTMSKHRQQRDVLATLIWPELDQERASAALRSTLSSFKVVMPVDWLHKERTTLAINKDNVWIDVDEFLTLMDRARSHHHEGNALCEECASYLQDAVDLYRADFMDGYSVPESDEFESWQMMQRERLMRELSYALRRLADFAGGKGEFEIAIAYATQWLALDPLHEPAHRMLMRLYAASGQRTAALRQYQRCVEILDEELATPPEEETNRLYAAIQSEGTLAFSSSVTSARKSSLLPTLPSLVIGREETLREIKAHLGIGGKMRSTTVIQGWPGVGKSTTVAALAHDSDIDQAFPDGVLWTSLGEAPNLLTEIAAWATTLGLTLPSNERNADAISAQLVTVLKDRRMLLIVDDVWQVAHARPFNVGGHACATILTTRLNDVAQSLAPTAFDVFRLSVLTEQAALELLSRLTPETVSNHPNEARELVRDLEGLPLAIQVAGRLLNAEARLGWGVSNLLQELRAGAALLSAQVPGDLMRSGQETSPTISALLRRSTEALDPDMKQKFALLGVFVPKPATFDLGAMAAAWDSPDPRSVARVLVNRGLLEPVTGGRFQMHALLVLHARALLDELMSS